MVGGDPVPQETPMPPTVGDAAPAETPEVDPEKLAGQWAAKRSDGAVFSLTLTPDNKFTWRFSRAGSKGAEFSGNYSVDGAVLVLTRADGSEMPGLVTLEENGFNFKLYGGPEKDPGLDFKKT
jgi:hypothetical protein